MNSISKLHVEFCQERTVIRRLKQGTIKWHVNAISKFIQFHGGKITLIDQITTENLREFLYNGNIERNWTPATFWNYYKCLRSFLNWLKDRSYIVENPILRIDKPKIPPRRPRALSKDDALRIIQCALNMRTTYKYQKYRNGVAFALMLYAGLRPGEVLNLKVSEVDLENNTLHVVNAKCEKHRSIPILPPLRTLLLEYINERDRLNKNSISFLTSAQHDRPFTYNGLKRAVEMIRNKTKINFTPHQFRHTCATFLLEGGADVVSIMNILGHASIQTTLIYLTISSSHLRDQMKKHSLNYQYFKS